MAIIYKEGRFQFQRGKKEDWIDSDLILLDGEIAIESDTYRIKIGNGFDKYQDLKYFGKECISENDILRLFEE